MIVIVGAGPAGLALAHELQRRGLAYRVLERGVGGESWRNHHDRLHLHTLKEVSGLPGLAMPDSYPPFPAGIQFHRYLARYAEEQCLNIEIGVTVERATFDGARWHLATNRGTLAAATLVVATGIWSTPRRAHLPGEGEFGGAILHARDYRNADPFAGRRVLVVGAGNSGSDIAVDLREHGVETAIAVRDGVAFVPRPTSPLAMRAAARLLRILPRVLSR